MKKFAKFIPIKARASLTEVERRVVRIEQKATTQEASSSGGGTTVLSGTALLTVPGPRGQFEHEETVAASGVTGSMRVFPAIAPHADSDENSEQALDVLAMAGEPGSGTITFRLAFGALTSGQIKINYMAV